VSTACYRNNFRSRNLGSVCNVFPLVHCRQVKGCPLKVNVNAVCDASKVLCTGDGLGIGTVGKDIRSFIDTRRAGPGTWCEIWICGFWIEYLILRTFSCEILCWQAN